MHSSQRIIHRGEILPEQINAHDHVPARKDFQHDRHVGEAVAAIHVHVGGDGGDGDAPARNVLEHDCHVRQIEHAVAVGVSCQIRRGGNACPFSLGIPRTRGGIEYRYRGEIEGISPELGRYAFDLTSVTVLYPPAGTGYSEGEWASVASAPYLAGDANGDGVFNLADVTVMLKHIAGWGISVAPISSDVNMDGGYSLSDVTVMLKVLAGWDVVMGIDLLR